MGHNLLKSMWLSSEKSGPWTLQFQRKRKNRVLFYFIIGSSEIAVLISSMMSCQNIIINIKPFFLIILGLVSEFYLHIAIFSLCQICDKLHLFEFILFTFVHLIFHLFIYGLSTCIGKLFFHRCLFWHAFDMMFELWININIKSSK